MRKPHELWDKPAPLVSKLVLHAQRARWIRAQTLMTSAFRIALAGLAFWATASNAAAQVAADAMNGHAVAQRVCGQCHAVEAGERLSPHPQVPTFTAVANARGQTATALRVWFQSPHRSMPDLVLGEQESDDLIAYILSLKRRT